jgi:hypothetical protein
MPGPVHDEGKQAHRGYLSAPVLVPAGSGAGIFSGVMTLWAGLLTGVGMGVAEGAQAPQVEPQEAHLPLPHPWSQQATGFQDSWQGVSRKKV